MLWIKSESLLDMSMESRHIIQRQIFQLRLDKEEYHHELSEEIKKVFNTQVIPELSKAFDQISKGKAIRINKLEIELPSMNLKNWKEKLPVLLVQEIKQQIELQSIEITEKENHLGQIGESHIAESKTKTESNIIEAFLFFCQKGYFPWWFQPNSFTIFEEKILNVKINILESEIHRVASKKSHLERLVKQFSDDFFVAYFNKQQKGSQLISDKVFWEKILTQIKSIPLKKRRIKEIVLKSMLFSQFISSIEKGENKSTEKRWIGKIIELIQIETKQSKTDIALEIFNIIKFNEKSKHNYIITHIEEFIQKESGKTNFGDNSLISKNKENIDDSFITPFSELGDKKRRPEEEDINFSEDIHYIKNAGIVIIWPFLTRFFESLDLTSGKDFKNEESQMKAILISQYLVDGKTHWNENELFINKIICGFPLWKTIPTDLDLTPEIEEQSKALFASIIEYWKQIKNTSREGVQNGFLQREGKLEMPDNHWKLNVNRETLDVLLDHIPWSFRMVKLPWMKIAIHVNW